MGALAEAIAQASQAAQMRQEIGLSLNRADDLATLAAAYLKKGALAQAETQAHACLNILDACEGDGPEFPQRDYFICYQVFADNKPDLARICLQKAYDLLQRRAANIEDKALQASFLTQIQSHVDILTAFDKFDKTDP
jgi:hypothetical protein